MDGAPAPVPPGPGLAVRLALVDAGALPDEQLMGFVHDQYRQLAYQQEQVWAALAEVARRPPLHVTAPDGLTAERQLDLAAAEISAELRLSQFAAERELSYGLDLQELPRVAAALRAGELDRVKAVVLLEALRDLAETHRKTRSRRDRSWCAVHSSMVAETFD